MDLSIIIVNYQVPYFLEQCLHSVHAAIQPLNAEVWVVDNHSNDDSQPYLTPKFPWVHWLWLNENVGFAKANNLALQQCTGKYVLFLNPDTIITSNALQQCIKHLTVNDKCGLVGVQMIDGAGRFLPESKRSLPTPIISFWKMIGASTLFPNSAYFNAYALGHLPQGENHPVAVIAGAFMMGRRSLLQQLQGFDERFFMYGEDVDISYRATIAGFTNYYIGKATIVHFKGESTQRGSLNYVRVFYEAMLLFVRKHYRGKGALFLRFALQLAIIARGIYAFFSNIFSSTKQPLITRAFLYGSSTAVTSAEQVFANANTSASVVLLPISNATLTGKSVWQPNEALVWCIDEQFTYEQAVTYTQRKSGTFCLWHQYGSGAVVGSAHKNAKGVVFTHAKNPLH
ncbi:MAG: glycosyltransferase family 2 protein [Chitinophagaceae bacterium]